MKPIVDEGVSRRLVKALRARGNDLSPFPNEWKGLKNGALLSTIVEAGFDCIVTCDTSLQYQQNLSRRQIAVVVLPWTRFADLSPLMTSIEQAILTAKTGSVRTVNRDGSIR